MLRMAIPSKALKDINKYFNKHVKYGKLTTIERIQLINDTITICKGHKIEISPMQLITMRDTFIYLLSKTKGTLAHRLGDNIMIDYNSKMSIINIAEKYDLPPMAIVNQILIENKYESHKIEKMIKKQKLPKDIQGQMTEIMKIDPLFWFPCNIPNIHNKLNKLHCAYQIKYDLRKMGKCPDILFDNKCTYKRKSFSWIVFKPYILFDSPLHLHDIQKTVNNFSRFGTGLILYNDIVCSKSFIKKIESHVDVYTFLD